MQRIFIILFFIFSSQSVLAEFSSKKKVNSLFNSHLLEKDETLIDTIPLGRLSHGVTENLELGTSTYLFFSAPNIFVKHRMFKKGRTEASFSSWSLMIPKAKSKDSQFSGLFSMHGILTSTSLTDNQSINFGVMRGYALSFSSEKDLELGNVRSRAELEAYSAVIGYEWYLSSKWALNSFYVLPFYASGEITGDLGDAKVSFLGTKQLRNPSGFGTVSLTRSWDVFNFEFGLFQMSSFTLPYISLIWRW